MTDVMKEYLRPQMIKAVYSNNIEKVKTLIEKGADVNMEDKFGTILHMTSWHGHMEIARMLLDAGADIDAEDGFGSSPLYSACEGGHAQMVAMLLDRGAVTDARNRSGDVPLHVACATACEDVVHLLLDAGAPVNAKNKDGDTPIDLLLRNIDPSNIAREQILDLFRQYAPEMVMEKFCTKGPGR